MTQQKSLGQIAYEADVLLNTPFHVLPWADLGAPMQAQYERIAQAVDREVRQRIKADLERVFAAAGVRRRGEKP